MGTLPGLWWGLRSVSTRFVTKLGRIPRRVDPLAYGFKEENGSGLRDIQGINLAGHGDTDGKLTVPDWAHTSVLSAQDQRTGETQIDLGIALTG